MKRIGMAGVVVTLSLCAATSAGAAEPLTQAAKLTASDAAASDFLGTSTAVSADTLVAGAPNDDVGINADQGTLRVFAKPAGGWADATETATLTASDGAAAHRLGAAVAIEGDTIVAGAPGSNALYVFVKPPAGWTDATQTAKLTVPGIDAFAELGTSVDIAGDVVVGGAQYSTAGGANNEGAAYVFEKPSVAWSDVTHSATLVNFYGAADDLLGLSVATNGQSVAAGVPSFSNDRGEVAVFNRPLPTSWNLGGAIEYHEAMLTAPDAADDDFFGYSVAMSGNTIAVGAPRNTIDGQLRQGSVYLYEGAGEDWPNVGQLTASDGTNGDLFGWSTAIEGSRLVAGALRDNNDQGSAYVFTNPGTGWADATETAHLFASDGAVDDEFGASVAASAQAIGVGAHSDTQAANWQGSAYVFAERAAPVPVPVCAAEALSVGKAKLNGRKGTAKLAVSVPCPGSLELSGKGLRTVAREVATGEVKLPVRPNRKTKRRLKDRGTARVRATVILTASDGGPAASKSKRIKLKLER